MVSRPRSSGLRTWGSPETWTTSTGCPASMMAVRSFRTVSLRVGTGVFRVAPATRTAACGSGSASGPAKTPTPYDAAVLVAGATRNTPVPTLSDTVRKDLTAIMLAGHPVDVVQVSGEPQVLNPDDLGLETISGGTGTAAGNQAVTEDNLNAISQVIASAPNADGASYFEALMMAADKAAARGATSPYLVLIGSGLDDQGGLSFVPAGMLGADAAEVVSQLRAAGTLANPERLRGTTVVLSGFGYTAQD